MTQEQREFIDYWEQAGCEHGSAAVYAKITGIPVGMNVDHAMAAIRVGIRRRCLTIELCSEWGRQC